MMNYRIYGFFFVLWSIAAISCTNAPKGCSSGSSKKVNAARSKLDLLPVLQDQRWAWGMGAPTLLLRGHFTSDRKEDVLIVSEPIVQAGSIRQHFTLLEGPALSPGALKTTRIRVDPALRDYAWRDKILSVAAAHAVDFNRDGRLDVIVAYKVGRIALFLGEDQGQTFRLSRVWTSESDGLMSEPKIAVQDWNGDGTLDLIVAGKEPFIAVWKQHAGLQFSSHWIAFNPRRIRRRRLQRRVRLWPASAQVTHPKVNPATSQPVQHSSILHWSEWYSTHALLGVDVDADGMKDLVWVGQDRKKQTQLRWIRTLQAKGPVVHVTKSRFLSGVYPSSTPIRSSKLHTLPLGAKKAPQSFVVASSLFASINMRGVGIVRSFQSRYDTKRQQWSATSEQLMLGESALSFGLTTGQFSADSVHGMVLFSPYRMIGYTPRKRLFTYDLRTDPLIRGRLSLRDAVGADLQGGGTDSLVMLSLGALHKKDPIGIQILILRKPLFP